MQTQITFNNRRGIRLSGALHTPDQPIVRAFALYAHCFTCTKSIRAAVTIANSLEHLGIATLRIDFTGLGGSQGDFSQSTFSSDVSDLVDAAEFLSREYQAPQLLMGHSLGGTAMLAAAEHISEATAVVSLGAPSEPAHILHLLEGHLNTLRTQGQAEVTLAGRPFSFRQSFVDNVVDQKLDYRRLRKALLVMHSPIDDTVSVDEAGRIFSAAMHPKSFVSLNDADHLLSKTKDAEYAAATISAWVEPYLLTQPKQTIGDAVKSRNQDVTVLANTQQGFLCNVTVHGHRLIADEPLGMGGTNLGPSPYDLLGAALGSCTAMTLNMYARHKKMALRSVSVGVSHERIHADDCAECESESGHVDLLSRSIQLDGDVSQDQRERLLQIADRCPVHKTLENEIHITTRITQMADLD